jgi:hypothetical protein
VPLSTFHHQLLISPPAHFLPDPPDLIFLKNMYFATSSTRAYIRLPHPLNVGLSIAWTPLHPVFFSLFWGHVFFAFQHNLGTFCRGELLKLVWISAVKILIRSLILLFPQENRTFGISGINWCHLGAELSILRCRKRFRGSITPKKNFGYFFGLIWGHVAPPSQR